SFTNGSLTINPATLTVTADNQSRVYGAANPGLTATYSGFVNEETSGTSGVQGQPALSTTATPTSPVGSYPITAAQRSLTAVNYVFNFVNGTLTVFATQPTILSLNGAGTTNVTVQWTSVSNVTYRLQYVSDLTSGNWSNVTPDVTATDNTASATDSSAG